MENIITSYNQAEYFIDNIDEPIKIGKTHAKIEELLKQFGVSSWSFLTAWNPLSVEFSAEENIARNENLRNDLAKYQIFEGEGRDSNGEWQPERSFLVFGISRKKAKSLAVKYNQRAIIYGESGKPAELMETLFTQGNCKIICRDKTAFLCSRKVPASVVLKCYDWAIEQRDAGNCVISGFHSTIERDVLHYLLKGEQPIIIALARGLKKELERELQKPFDNSRLLIISPFESQVKRADNQTAAIRNRLMIEMAERICIGYASSGGSLEKLVGTIAQSVNYL